MYSKYIISQTGEIISKYSGLVKCTHTCKKGYHRVNLRLDDGTKCTRLVHRLVAQEYIPNPLNLPQVNHKDGNKNNNSVNNLEWVTNQQNTDHAVILGLIPKGKERPNSKLTDEQVLKLRKLREIENLSYYELARLFGIAYQTAHKICSRQTYTHI